MLVTVCPRRTLRAEALGSQLLACCQQSFCCSPPVLHTQPAVKARSKYHTPLPMLHARPKVKWHTLCSHDGSGDHYCWVLLTLLCAPSHGKEAACTS